MSNEPTKPSVEFLFDDFFVAMTEDDPGQLQYVPIRGRQVPVYLKRGLSFADRDYAKSQAVKTRVKPNGLLEIVSLDESVFAVELVYRCLVSWPFKYKDGYAVPITRETIKAMFADGADALTQIAMQLVNGRREAMQPFTTPSEQS